MKLSTMDILQAVSAGARIEDKYIQTGAATATLSRKRRCLSTLWHSETMSRGFFIGIVARGG